MGTSEIIGSLLDPYEALGVPKHASAEEIRKCYKKLALTYHPDKTRDESNKSQNLRRFQEIREAYEILNDEHKRKEYDDAQITLAQIRELKRQEKEAREKARKYAARQRDRDDDLRRRDAERKAQIEADRRAEKEYRLSKKNETDQLEAAKRAQELRKMQADAKRAAEDDDRKADKSRRESREERKRREAEQKRLRDEDLLKQEELMKETERINQEEERRHRENAKERRDKDRRRDREDKSEKYFMPPYEELDIPEVIPIRLERLNSDRGRASRERLREPLVVPRDNSRSGRREGSRTRDRDNSRHRERSAKERDIPRDIPREEPLRDARERVRRADFYEANPRRMSTEPIHDTYLRTPPSGPYGSPPQPAHSQSYYSPHAVPVYSPPASPRPRSSMPAMSSSQSFPAPQKGRERTRDRASGRKQSSEIPLYTREGSSYITPEDLEHQLPGNRDSGYSTSSNTTPLKGVDVRISNERLNPDSVPRDGGAGRTKYKWVSIQVPISDDEGSLEREPLRDSHRRSSRDEHSSPRQSGSPPDADPDPFIYMTSGSKSFSYATGADNHYPKLHMRHNSDTHHSVPPKINLEEPAYNPAYKPRHHSSREAPSTSGGSAPYYAPSFHRGATWSGTTQ